MRSTRNVQLGRGGTRLNQWRTADREIPTRITLTKPLVMTLTTVLKVTTIVMAFWARSEDCSLVTPTMPRTRWIKP